MSNIYEKNFIHVGNITIYFSSWMASVFENKQTNLNDVINSSNIVKSKFDLFWPGSTIENRMTSRFFIIFYTCTYCLTIL